jgi:DNA repair exonuclease SbcCD ATPase subunit
MTVWIESITLYNMKNHANAFVEFTPGLNVICGESGTGKTNIFTTIEWIFADTVSTQNHMIGSFDEYCSAKIILCDRDNEKYIIEKFSEHDNRKNVFFLNGQILYANNNKIPDAVKYLNPIKVVTVNGNTYSPQMRKQGDPYFMLDSNQVDRISLCFWGTDVLILETMKKDTQKEIDKTEKTIQDRQSKLNDATSRIESMSYIGDWRNRLTAFRLKRDRYNAVDAKLVQIENLQKELSQIKITKAQYDSLPSLEAVDQLISHYTIYYALTDYEHQLAKIAVAKEEYKSLPDLGKVDQSIQLYNRMSTINHLIGQVDETSAGLIKYTTTIEVPLIDSVIGKLNTIVQTTALVSELEYIIISKSEEESKIALNPLKSIDKLISDSTNLGLINQFVAELDSIKTSTQQLNQQVEAVSNEIAVLEQALDSVTACPLCTQPVERWTY